MFMIYMVDWKHNITTSQWPHDNRKRRYWPQSNLTDRTQTAQTVKWPSSDRMLAVWCTQSDCTVTLSRPPLQNVKVDVWLLAVKVRPARFVQRSPWGLYTVDLTAWNCWTCWELCGQHADSVDRLSFSQGQHASNCGKCTVDTVNLIY